MGWQKAYQLDQGEARLQVSVSNQESDLGKSHSLGPQFFAVSCR